MTENKMEEVAQLLGLELEEEFNIDDYGDFFSNFSKFKLTERGLFCWSNMDRRWCGPIDIPNKLLTGENKIINLSKQILTEKEKKYLSAVIKPFRDKVDSISKRSCDNGQYIAIEIDEPPHGSEIFFPYFEQGTMYQGMTVGKYYTLEELDL